MNLKSHCRRLILIVQPRKLLLWKMSVEDIFSDNTELNWFS